MADLKKSTKNGKIELLRFFFCISVVLYHAGGDILGDGTFLTPVFSVFAHGRSGVEFFFLLSGYLAAKSAGRMKNSNTSIGRDTYSFIWRKVSRIFPYHIIACVLSIISMIMFSENAQVFWNNLGLSIPSWFFLQRTGIKSTDLISIEWYICSMLLALAIIYPLLRKWYDMMLCVVAPVLSSLMIGYMLHTYGEMPGYRTWGSYTYICNLRGFAVVLLGVFVYFVSEQIRAHNFTKKQWIWLAVLEDAAWAFAIYFIFSSMEHAIEGYFVYFTALAMAISFARDYNSKFYQSKFVSYLGRISLSIYLCQNFARNVIGNNRVGISDAVTIILILLLAIGVGVLVDFLYNLFKNRKRKNIA